MDETDLSAAKEAATELLSNAYARDLISLEQLETRLSAVTDADSKQQVAQLVVDLAGRLVEAGPGAVLKMFPQEQQLIRGSMHSLRLDGRWLRSKRIVLLESGSSIRIDLAELGHHPGQVFELELGLKASSCRIKVPRGTRVEQRLEQHFSSYRCSASLRRSADPNAATLVIKGRISASSVRISPGRRPRD